MIPRLITIVYASLLILLVFALTPRENSPTIEDRVLGLAMGLVMGHRAAIESEEIEDAWRGRIRLGEKL